MTFLHPWWLLLVPFVLGLLALLYVRPRSVPVTVPSVLLWRVLSSRVREDRIRRKRRPDLFFFVYAAALSTALLIMAEGMMGRETAWMGRLLVFVDDSASMAARDEGRTILEKAVEYGVRYLSSLPPQTVVRVATPSGRLSDEISPSAAARFLRNVSPTGTAWSLESRPSLPRDLTRRLNADFTLILTDSVPDGVSFDMPFRAMGFGRSLPNFFVRHVVVDDGGGVYAWVSASGGGGKVRVVVDPPGRSVDTEVKEGAVVRVFMGNLPPETRRFRVYLQVEDAMAEDDGVEGVFDGVGECTVLVCGDVPGEVEAALEAIPGVRLVHASRIPPRGPAVIGHKDVGTLPVGKVALIMPSSMPGARVGKVRLLAALPRIRTTSSSLLRILRPEHIGATEALDVSLPGDFDVLVDAGGVPLIALRKSSKGESLYIGFDISESLWWSYRSFPVFWYEFFGPSPPAWRLVQRVPPPESCLKGNRRVVEKGKLPSAAVRKAQVPLSPWLAWGLVFLTGVLVLSMRV